MFPWQLILSLLRISGVQSLFDGLKQAFDALTNWLTSTFKRWVNAFIHVVQMTEWAAGSILRLGQSVIAMGLRLGLHYLPALAQTAINDALTLARRELNAVRDLLAAAINDAMNLARTLVNELRQAVVDGFNWFTGMIAGILDRLVAVERWVYNLLTHPRALADWISGEIVGAVYRWALGSAEALARWAFGLAVRGALASASLLERIIADIFM